MFAMFIQDPLIRRIGMKATYLFGLLTFATAMLLMIIFPSVIVINLCSALSGFGTSVANTIPGTLITKYHASPELYLGSEKETKGYIQGIFEYTQYISHINTWWHYYFLTCTPCTPFYLFLNCFMLRRRWS